MESPKKQVPFLADEIMREIFVRLDSHVSVITCKFVSKSWLSLLSDPKFVLRYINHNKFKNKTLPWSFLSTLTMHLKKPIKQTKSPTHKFFHSPKFSLNFLPFPFKVASTFKDLVLCTIYNLEGIITTYYICNPVTKHFVALPPPPSPHRHNHSWATLICQDPYFNDKLNRIDYRFRVVVVNPIPYSWLSCDPFKIVKMVLFITESCEWVKIDLKISLPRSQECWVKVIPFDGFVCMGMVCFRMVKYFGMFDPFDSTLNTNSNGCSFEAKIARVPPTGIMFESGGRLILMLLDKKILYAYDRKDKSGSGLGLSMFSIHIDIDFKQVMNRNEIESKVKLKLFCSSKCKGKGRLKKNTQIIGMHPRNMKLLYVLNGDQVLLVDMKAKRLKRLGRLSEDRIVSSHRLELQCWPTLIPHIDFNIRSLM